jgi:hypothetical protein
MSKFIIEHIYDKITKNDAFILFYNGFNIEIAPNSEGNISKFQLLQAMRTLERAGDK